MEDRIVVENVSKKFGKETVLRDVSLTVKNGSIVGIVGLCMPMPQKLNVITDIELVYMGYFLDGSKEEVIKWKTLIPFRVCQVKCVSFLIFFWWPSYSTTFFHVQLVKWEFLRVA